MAFYLVYIRVVFESTYLKSVKKQTAHAKSDTFLSNSADIRFDYVLTMVWNQNGRKNNTHLNAILSFILFLSEIGIFFSLAFYYLYSIKNKWFKRDGEKKKSMVNNAYSKYTNKEIRPKQRYCIPRDWIYNRIKVLLFIADRFLFQAKERQTDKHIHTQIQKIYLYTRNTEKRK